MLSTQAQLFVLPVARALGLNSSLWACVTIELLHISCLKHIKHHVLLILSLKIHGTVKPNAISFNSAIHACGRSGEWEQALRLLREMRELSLPPDDVSFGATVRHVRKLVRSERYICIVDKALCYKAVCWVRTGCGTVCEARWRIRAYHA